MAKTTDELFAEATEADYETAEPVTLAASDTEEEFQFRIDEHLRTIAIPEKGVVAGVEGDLNVNIARFTMTRYYHGRDLSKLNIRINYRNANGQVNYYTVSDATISGDSIVFSWEYAADVTQYKGNVQFVVYLFSATSAVLKQKFFTTLGTLEVLEGLDVDSSIPVSEQTDILLHLKKDLSAYAEEVKKSLPADYTAMTEQVSSLKEEIANLKAGGLTTAKINALDGLFKVVAYIKDDVSAEYAAFLAAFDPSNSGGSGTGGSGGNATTIVNLFDKNTMVRELADINTSTYNCVVTHGSRDLITIPIDISDDTWFCISNSANPASGWTGYNPPIVIVTSTELTTTANNDAFVRKYYLSNSGLKYGDDRTGPYVTDENVIAKDTTGVGIAFLVPANAKYIYVDEYHNDPEYWATLMIEKGKTCHDYVEYVRL